MKVNQGSSVIGSLNNLNQRLIHSRIISNTLLACISQLLNNLQRIRSEIIASSNFYLLNFPDILTMNLQEMICLSSILVVNFQTFTRRQISKVFQWMKRQIVYIWFSIKLKGGLRRGKFSQTTTISTFTTSQHTQEITRKIKRDE